VQQATGPRHRRRVHRLQRFLRRTLQHERCTVIGARTATNYRLLRRF
jgi:hypothetical protein